MAISWELGGGVHPTGALTSGLSKCLGLLTAGWLTFPEPTCPGQEAELAWCLGHHSLLVKAVKGLFRFKVVGECQDHIAEKHMSGRSY